MKWIRYTYCGNPVELSWSEANEEIAKQEAETGYTIDDDGAAETLTLTQAERIAELEAALAQLLSKDSVKKTVES